MWISLILVLDTNWYMYFSSSIIQLLFKVKISTSVQYWSLKLQSADIPCYKVIGYWLWMFTLYAQIFLQGKRQWCVGECSQMLPAVGGLLCCITVGGSITDTTSTRTRLSKAKLHINCPSLGNGDCGMLILKLVLSYELNFSLFQVCHSPRH